MEDIALELLGKFRHPHYATEHYQDKFAQYQTFDIGIKQLSGKLGL